MNYPQKAFNTVLDTLFPVRCVGCGFYDTYLCDTCRAAIKIRNDFECIGCKRPAPKGSTCGDCRINFAVNKLFIATDYENPLVKKLLRAFKYNFIAELAGPLAELIRYYIEGVSKEWEFNVLSREVVLVPIPLHKKRFNWRGFNQAELLAQNLALKYEVEYCPDFLKRIRDNKPQADVENKEERLSNLYGVFEAAAGVYGKDIVLVDDVCTTGTTLNECAKVLLVNGAKSVGALVIARG